MNRIPKLIDPDGVFSGCCKKPAGLRDLDRIPRTLPTQVILNEDAEVLQDESGAPFNDETDNSFIYDTLKNGGQFN